MRCRGPTVLLLLLASLMSSGSQDSCPSLLGLEPAIEQERTCTTWRTGSFTGRSIATVSGIFSQKACMNAAKRRYPHVRDITVRLADGVCTFKDPEDCSVSYVSDDTAWMACSMPPLYIPVVEPVIPVLSGPPVVNTAAAVRKHTVPRMLDQLHAERLGLFDFEALITNGYHLEDVNNADADGWTAAHWAVYYGKVEHLGALINAGADARIASSGPKSFVKAHSGLGSTRMAEATNSPSHDFSVPAGSTPRDIIIERYKVKSRAALFPVPAASDCTCCCLPASLPARCCTCCF